MLLIYVPELMNCDVILQMSFPAHASNEQHQPAGVQVQSQADFIMGMANSESHDVQYNHTVRDNQHQEHQNFQLSLPAKILLSSRGHNMAQGADNESFYSGDARTIARRPHSLQGCLFTRIPDIPCYQLSNSLLP